jgi:hypothetical protein
MRPAAQHLLDEITAIGQTERIKEESKSLTLPQKEF